MKLPPHYARRASLPLRDVIHIPVSPAKSISTPATMHPARQSYAAIPAMNNANPPTQIALRAIRGQSAFVLVFFIGNRTGHPIVFRYPAIAGDSPVCD